MDQQGPALEDLSNGGVAETAADVSGAHPTIEPSQDPASVVPPSRSRVVLPDDAASASGSGPSRIASLLHGKRAEVVDLVSLGVLAVVVLLLKLELIGIGGDAIRKWHFVRQWFYRNDFSDAKWDHHMARFGVNGVAYLVQLVFGRGPRQYYIAPLSAAVVQVLFVYLCGKRLGGRLAGVLGALLLIVFPPFHQGASQLLPEVFSGAYAIIGMYLLLRYLDAEEPVRTRWLGALSLVLFVSYLAKETNVFFFPGFAGVVWIGAGKHRVRDLALLLGILAFGLACETAFYHHFTHYAHRFAVVTELHPSDAPELETDFWGLFARYEAADPPWHFAFYTFCATSLGVLAFAQSSRASAALVVGWSYFFFLTFLIRGLHPIIIWQTFRSRYLDPAAPFVMLTTGLFLSLVATEGFRRHAPRRLASAGARASRLGSAWVIGITALVGFGYYVAARPTLDDNPLLALPRMQALATDTYERNFPIISARDTNGLWAVYSTLLDDHLLARNGILPEFDDVEQHGAGKTYIAKDPSVYTKDMLKRFFDKRCFMEAVGKDGHFFMRRATPIARECDAELRRR